MQALITKWKDWKDGSHYPVLAISAIGTEHKEELEALQLIERSVSDILGRVYGGRIVSTQKGSGQLGIFTVDLSAILTMLQAVRQNQCNGK